MKKQINIGIIGLGYWGSNGLRIFAESPKVNLVMCCDSDPHRITLSKAICDKPQYSRHWTDIIHNPRIDAVVISTPAFTHYKIVLSALKSGKHVFVEKPLALKVSEAIQLCDLASKAKKVLLVGHVYLFNPSMIKLKEYIDQNQFGKIHYIHSTRTGLGPVRSDANALWDLATHDIAILLYFLKNKPKMVSANGAAFLHPKVFDVVFLNIYFENNVIANIHVSWLDPLKIRRLTIVGSKQMGMFDENDAIEKIRIFKEDLSRLGVTPAFGESRFLLRLGDVYSPSIPTSEPLKKECEHFVHCVATGASPISDGKFGVRVVQVLEAAQKSLDSGGDPIKIKS